MTAPYLRRVSSLDAMSGRGSPVVISIEGSKDGVIRERRACVQHLRVDNNQDNSVICASVAFRSSLGRSRMTIRDNRASAYSSQGIREVT